MGIGESGIVGLFVLEFVVLGFFFVNVIVRIWGKYSIDIISGGIK